MRIFGRIADPISSFFVNKGSVNVLRSAEDFKVRYSDELEGHVEIRSDARGLSVEVKREIPGAHVDINIAALEKCSVAVGSGLLRADEFCKESSFSVQNGQISTRIVKSEVGVVEGRVGLGTLSNSSGLHSVEQAAGGAPSFMSGFFTGGYMPAMGGSVKLVGDLGQDHSVHFDVGNGMLDLH